jgi:hypothetical protein
MNSKELKLVSSEEFFSKKYITASMTIKKIEKINK